MFWIKSVEAGAQNVLWEAFAIYFDLINCLAKSANRVLPQIE